MQKIIKEFKEFAVKGNVVDLAVGVIIGGAFGKIVSSLVSDIISPLLSLITNNIDLKNLKIVLKQNAAGVPATINYGLFIENIINFLIISFVIFLFIKGLNALRMQKEASEESKPKIPPRQEILLEEIRDLLSKKDIK